MTFRWPFLLPLLFMTAGMALSISGGYYFDLSLTIAAFSLLFLSGFLPYPKIFSLFTAIFFFCLGMFVLQLWLSPKVPLNSIKNRVYNTPITIEGVITERPSVAPEGSRLIVQVETVITQKYAEATSGLIMLYVSKGDISLSRGDRIRFNSRVIVPHLLGIPGEFNYSRYLAFQGISATARVTSESDIVLIMGDAVSSRERIFDHAARLLGDAIRKAVPEIETSSVLTALLIGDQRRIPRDLSDLYTKAGVNHILSISGFHVGIISAFITLIMLWLLTRFEYLALRWNVRQIALLIAVPAMVAYLFLTGNAPSTARSVIMLTVFAAALFAEREMDSINTLLFAAFFLVAINPPTLFDVSFQLSFFSLWGILLAAPPILKYSSPINLETAVRITRSNGATEKSTPYIENGKYQKGESQKGFFKKIILCSCSVAPLLRVSNAFFSIKPFWLRGIVRFLGVSVVASFVTVIPVLFIFKIVSLNGILTNFIIVPLLGYGAVLTGFIVLPFILLIPGYAPLLISPAAALVNISNKFIKWCTALPVINFYGITLLDMLFFILFMLCMTFVVSKVKRAVIGALIPLTALLLHIYTDTNVDGLLHITMLSVGQAESIFIKLPDGSNLLVDGGGYLHDNGNDFGQRIIAPALGALHVRRIDTMIATHNHPDHSGGLPYIIKNFTVGQFWSIKDVTSEIETELNIKKIPKRTLTAGDVIRLPGSVLLTVLSPRRSGQRVGEEDEMSMNEQSMVFRLSYGDFSMIFCADAGFKAEKIMMVANNELKSTVLKVGHHGSSYSTSEKFLEEVQPDLALISAGLENRFGLPSLRTTKLLESKKIPIYRTDRDGTIELITDGVGWSVKTDYRVH